MAKRAYLRYAAAAKTRGPGRIYEHNPKRALRRATNYYNKSLIRRSIRNHWRDFVTAESANNVWGRHDRTIKMPNRAVTKSVCRKKFYKPYAEGSSLDRLRDNQKVINGAVIIE